MGRNIEKKTCLKIQNKGLHDETKAGMENWKRLKRRWSVVRLRMTITFDSTLLSNFMTYKQPRSEPSEAFVWRVLLKH